MKKERAPAQIVSCPHCDWKGSARGLYTHCRMGHPNKSLPETKGTRVQYTVHPQADKASISPKKGLKRKKRWTEEDETRYQRLLRILELWIMSRMPDKPVTQLGAIPKNIEESTKRLSDSDVLKLLYYVKEKSFRARE